MENGGEKGQRDGALPQARRLSMHSAGKGSCASHHPPSGSPTHYTARLMHDVHVQSTASVPQGHGVYRADRTLTPGAAPTPICIHVAFLCNISADCTLRRLVVRGLLKQWCAPRHRTARRHATPAPRPIREPPPPPRCQ